MSLSHTLTFGGSGLDRAAPLRAADIGGGAHQDARYIVLWRGKPMILDDALVRVGPTHPVLADASPAHIFLGRDGDVSVFAADLSGWSPPDLDLTHLDTFLDASQQQHPAMPQGAYLAELRAIMTRLSPRDAELAATAKALQGWHGSHGFCARCGAASVFAKAGWQRDCPACGAHHFPRTDPVVIMLITHGNAVLVGRSHGWPAGMYSLLAGFVEPGETVEAAVRREVHEETGVIVGDVRYLASQPWPFPASLMLGCAGVAQSTALTIDPVEIEDAIWVSREDMALSFAGQHPTIKPAREGAIAHFLIAQWLADRDPSAVAQGLV
jgi:NAD+ diphosphatase